MTQTKDDIVAFMSQETGLTKLEAKAAFDAALECIISANERGEKVQLIGFGSFNVLRHPEHAGVNPVTHEKITIPAMVVPKFKPGLAYRKRVNNANSEAK